ncbi:plasmid replication/partition related protein [Acidovorax sp. RAC01]|mgnify:CR=1 FL=1|uniref:plasmid replication/partition related protein n=1 Tax=Acidovorax sp. RAC01 TaxID=1842533 RepID=UPI00083E8BCF|nr:plasmid replication/partition related protein [Acidovorax sp. RAC01]
MNIVVNEELKAYIEPLTPDEHEALERSLLAEGCRDALVLWGDVLVDGHNRYGICQKHGIPFQTVQNPRFQSLEDVHLWMIDQHLGRRSVSDFQRGVLALRKREIVAGRRARAQGAAPAAGSPPQDTPTKDAANPPADLPDTQALTSREAIARAARLSSSQVVMIEKIQKQAAPELLQAVKAGTISINAAAAVATLPAPEQVAAVAAGKDELRQAAKRVRDEQKRNRKPREGKAETDEAGVQSDGASASVAAYGDEEVHTLRQRVAALTAENAELRRLLAQAQAAQPADSPPF